MNARIFALAAAFSLLPGCQTTIKEATNAANDAAQYPFKTTLTLAAIGVAAYYVVDPLAPNWEVAEKQISDSRYRIDLRMKRFHLGGDGEAAEIFKRHAEELADRMGNGEYTLLAYHEGIDSNVTVPQRWSRGLIELSPHRASTDGRTP